MRTGVMVCYHLHLRAEVTQERCASQQQLSNTRLWYRWLMRAAHIHPGAPDHPPPVCCLLRSVVAATAARLVLMRRTCPLQNLSPSQTCCPQWFLIGSLPADPLHPHVQNTIRNRL
jgi:hypothetical protein